VVLCTTIPVGLLMFFLYLSFGSYFMLIDFLHCVIILLYRNDLWPGTRNAKQDQLIARFSTHSINCSCVSEVEMLLRWRVIMSKTYFTPCQKVTKHLIQGSHAVLNCRVGFFLKAKRLAT